ncbi:MAG: sensor histidine kinase [Planctomycetota bacterium]|jgi:PAS domain S-box-containing protein
MDQNQLNALVNAATDLVGLIDKEGLLIHANQAFADFFDVPLSGFIGTNLFHYSSEQLTQQRRQTLRRVLSTGESDSILQHENERYLEFSFHLLKSTDQNGERVAVCIRDITNFKDLMDEHERDRRLLKDANAELEGIIRIASHDLKTPLVTINGFAGELSNACKQLVDMLSQCDKPAPMKEKVQDIIEKDILVDVDLIKAGTAKVESLVSSLLKLARIGYETPQVESVEMNPLIDRILKSMAYQIKDTQVNVEVAQLCNCLGDKSMINQVMTNLLSNAIKYRHPERLTRIGINCYKQGDHCVYCVADNGIGVAENHQDKIFELFYRLDPGLSDGQGLGLSIVRGIVSRHNGRIWLESELDIGSRFYVTFPNPDAVAQLD